MLGAGTEVEKLNLKLGAGTEVEKLNFHIQKNIVKEQRLCIGKKEMNHFDNLPIDLQDHILKMKQQLEDKERREQEREADLRRKREVLNAMEEYLMDNGYWDDFVERFMEGLEGAVREEYVEHFGLEG